MKSDIKRHVSECQVCQMNKTNSLSPAGLLQPLPIPQNIWEDITMDFIEALSRSDRFDTIWVIVDRLCKYSHFVPLQHPFNAKGLARLFVKEIIRLHVIPKSIVSDRGKFFMGNFWQEIHKLQGTKLNFTSSYHLESDGQSEVVNKRLGNYLRCFSFTKPASWHSWLSWAEFCYNTSYHVSTRTTPFQIVYGRDPPALCRYGNLKSPVDDIDRYLQERDQVLTILKEQLSNAQNIMKATKDSKRRDVSVYLKLRPYRMRVLSKKYNEKMAPKYFGSYTVIQQINSVAYKLALPPESRLHPVFHVSQLKNVVGNPDRVLSLPSTVTDDLEWVVEPLQIKDIRGSGSEQVVLVQWKGLPDFESTWESAHLIHQRFPEFQLEDKLKLLAGRDGKTPVITYYCQKRNRLNKEERSGSTGESIVASGDYSNG